ncbi:O-acetyl-ADP-ribose deacetylase [Alteromonas gilva]|uniref:O-acetyl-ADP-ribose deacetylase n=1 Tax=Alteromonas gilva TaxID=2987522 RepID=A0ABT5L2J1_9ALTE|nr:O-acetyl-ADP-ribose deacetylase [Alteromonas gilva]MDC8831260.1 O-acetyl-ADP-ribose deacetylase [Alteromonas gilva]
MSMQLVLGDITQASVDAIVNAANPTLLGGGGVDGAIHRAAGAELLAACKALPQQDGVRCPAGEARITPAGRLSAQYIIHTVGPVYESDSNPPQTLRSAYQNSCELAIQYHCKSVAFPAISCGVYGFPHNAAARIALQSCRPFLHSLRVSFYLFDQPLYDCFVKQWQQLQHSDQQ